MRWFNKTNDNGAANNRLVLPISLFILAGSCPLFAQEDTLQKPQEFDLAEAAAANVVQSNLPPEAKEAVQVKFKQISTDFDRAWRKVLELRFDYKQTLDAFKTEKEGFETMKTQHDSNPPDPENEAAVANYNHEAEEGNKRIDIFREKCAKLDKDFEAKFTPAAKAIEQMCATSLPDFNIIVQKLLSGQIRFKKGLAWAQLEQAAKGYDMFDTTSTADPSGPVDARGVRLLTPAERQSELEKPRSQLPRGFHIAPNGPPPPLP